MALNKIKQELLATNLAASKKKLIFIVIMLFSIFPFFILYQISMPDMKASIWQLRHFIGIAVLQAVAQLSLSRYFLINKTPNYVIVSFLIMIIFFQVTYGVTVILLSNV